MIKYYILIVFLLFWLTSVAKPKRAEGYIITLDQDTVYGSFKLKTDKDKKLIYAKTQEKISFYDPDGKKTIYYPEEISLFYFYYDFETLTFKSVPYFKNGRLFMKVISESGNLHLYQFFPDSEKRLASVYELAEFTYSSGGLAEKFFFYIIKPDGEILLMGKHTPKRRIKAFFNDYPELAEKIDSREYNYSDVYKMVREYNTWKKEMANSAGSDND